MTKKIDSYIEFKIIQNWLRGMNREENARDCGIADGSVSNKLEKWLDSLFGYDIEAVREFALQVRKENITVKDCALGFRIYSILEQLGISDKDTQILFFLKNAYDLAKRKDIEPQIFQDCLSELFRISKEVTPSQIKSHIQNIMKEKETLKEQVINLKQDIQKLEKTKSDIETEFALMKEKFDIKSAELEWFINMKNSLEKERLPVDNISYLTRTIKTLKKYSNKEIFEILQKINDGENLDKEIESKKHVRDALSIDNQCLDNLNKQLSFNVSSKTADLESIDELERLGFGIQNLRKIRERLNSISLKNQMSPLEITEKFFEFLSEYEGYTTLEKEKAKLEYIVPELEKKY